MAVLDTDFLIALEQREDSAVAWLHNHRDDEHLVPDVVAVEYLTGHTEPEAVFGLLQASFTIAHGNPEWIRTSVSLRKRLRMKNVRFRTPDFWIACWAHHHDMPVITRNRRHFKPLGVRTETW